MPNSTTPMTPAVMKSLGERGAGDVDEHLLQQDAERRHGGDEKRVAMLGEHRHRTDRQHQEDAKAARNPAAGIQNEARCRRHRRRC